TSENLRAAWGEKAAAIEIEKVEPFLRADAPGDRAWLDFLDWYVESMNDYASFWMRETRKNFPKGDIYLCTGGNADPRHGSDFGGKTVRGVLQLRARRQRGRARRRGPRLQRDRVGREGAALLLAELSRQAGGDGELHPQRRGIPPAQAGRGGRGLLPGDDVSA